ncbi:hypothetical protein C7416_10582 [Cupriavidus phytorum]|uniref:Uncharacterized protein n=1 Tax=Cupriavidus phytorum TaxID=3024399 RepID=A0A2W7P7Z0_9BURK|nr:hypothetical protein C7416_10582 [Cupriavidus alkaliphilus]
MLAAIHFDDQFERDADEIRDIRPALLLTLEFQPQKSVGTEVVPKTLLRLGLVGAEHADECRCWQALALSPIPSPASGRGERGVGIGNVLSQIHNRALMS